MKNNNFNNLGNIQPVKFVSPMVEITKRMERVNKESERLIAEEKFRKTQYDQEVLETLQNIEKNTGDISQIISLLHNNSEKQVEILKVMQEIMSIGTSSTTDEAKSKYRTVMDTINTSFEDAETMEKLLGISKTFYHTALAYIKHRYLNGE